MLKKSGTYQIIQKCAVTNLESLLYAITFIDSSSPVMTKKLFYAGYNKERAFQIKNHLEINEEIGIIFDIKYLFAQIDKVEVHNPHITIEVIEANWNT